MSIISELNPSKPDLTTSCNTSLMDITANGKKLNDLCSPPHEEKNCDVPTERDSENIPRNAIAAQESPSIRYNQFEAETFKQLNGLDFSTSNRITNGALINEEVPYPQPSISQCIDTRIAEEPSFSEIDCGRKDVSAERDKFMHPVTEKNLMSRRDLYILTGEMVLDCLGKANYVSTQKSNYTRDECEFINELLSNLFSIYIEYTSAQRASPSRILRPADKNNVRPEEGNLMQNCSSNTFEDLIANLKHSKGIHVRKSNDMKNTEDLGTFNKKSGKTNKATRTQITNIRKKKSSKEKVKNLLKKNKMPKSQERKFRTIQNEMTDKIPCDNMATDDIVLSGTDFYNDTPNITADEEDLVINKTSRKNEKTEFLCDLCGAKFSEKKVLNGHRKYVHTENRPEQCELCDKRFKTKSQLANHKLVHKSEQDLDLSCEVCGKRFRRAGTLKDHVRRHKKDYSEFCMICGKGFYRNYWLQEHMRTHSGLKPYDCRICGFKTALKCNLNKHMKTHRT